MPWRRRERAALAHRRRSFAASSSVWSNDASAENASIHFLLSSVISCSKQGLRVEWAPDTEQ
jgi:hypothetical protein